jgi:competence protein ComEC
MFYVITLSFIFGIAFHSFFNLDPFFIYLFLLIIVVIGVFYRQNRIIPYITVAVVFLFLGFLRFEAQAKKEEVSSSEQIAYYNGQKVALTGRVIDEPSLGDKTIKYTVGDIKIEQRRIKGKLLASTRLYPRFKFGDWVQLQCKLKKPEKIEGFSYDKYLAKDGIYSLCYYPLMTRIDADYLKRIDADVWINLKRQIFRVKNDFLIHIREILPEPHSGLLAGILLGGTTGLPTDLKQKLIDSGTIHIVAVSGYNISIILTTFLTLTAYLYISRRTAWPIALIVLGVFIIITGAESSVVRAATMGIIAGMVKQVGRLSDVKRVLILTALMMLIINPYLLRFDIGFGLSFLATIGLIYITPYLDRMFSLIASSYLKKIEKIRIIITLADTIRESAATTIGANLAVFPLLLWQFGRVSLISPVVNILILWTIPLIMAMGFFAVFLSYAFLPLGYTAGWFVWVLLEYVIKIVQWF